MEDETGLRRLQLYTIFLHHMHHKRLVQVFHRNVALDLCALLSFF